MSAVALIFTRDGAGHGLYTEVVDLGLIGPLNVERATTIEFDNTIRYWRVRDRTGFALFNSPSRQECLDWERRYLESQEDMKHERIQHGADSVAAGQGIHG